MKFLIASLMIASIIFLTVLTIARFLGSESLFRSMSGFLSDLGDVFIGFLPFFYLLFLVLAMLFSILLH